MKKLSLIILALLYCFVISISKNLLILKETDSYITNEKTEYFSSLTFNFLLPTTQVEIVISHSLNSNISCFKKHFNEFWAIINNLNHFISFKYSQYKNISRNFPLCNITTKIIYPFHYFW